ncbi:serine/threonine protein kinase [Streptomyces palmae]|uniref:Serine/threonine protein kinase n=2 Tax=Streptomyces palmae TaxID=1701085 RepID=A0A4Z0G8Q3_9ACTN|nr:serine/threonine protein kinase [Streptomyces palmae]
MGVVYLARSASGRQVAVKVVHAQFAEDEEFRTRFRQEVAAARQVSGAFTAPVVDADPDAERPWMATLYVAGPTLAERLAEDGPLDAAELRRLALGLAEALRDIHRAGVVHRDLKPANVLMAKDGPRVIDFGISRAADNQTLTITGRVMGTPPFMSPEQLSRPREVTAASDVFSLAALLVFAATGHGPFDADSPYMTAYQVVHEPPALDQVAQPLRDLMADCLVKDPAARPGLPELMRRLRDLPEQGSSRVPEGEPAPTPVEYAPTSPGKRRRRTLSMLGAAVLALGAGIGGIMLYGFPGPDGGVRTAKGPAAGQGSVRLPSDWRPWELSLIKAAGVEPFDSDVGPGCLPSGTALFCGGLGLPVVRVNGADGRVNWRAKGLVTDARASDGGMQVSSVPFAVRHGLVFLQDTPEESHSRVVALRADTGELAWARKTTSAAESVLAGDLVVTSEPGDKGLVGLDATTGEVRWTTLAAKSDSCSPVVADGVPYALCASDGTGESDRTTLLRLDRQDGDPHSVAQPGMTDRMLGTHRGRLLFLPFVDSGLDEYPYLVQVDPHTGERHRVKLPPEAIGEAFLVGDRLFFVQESGRVTLVDPATGKKRWSNPTSLERLGSPAVVQAAGTVYLGTSSGRLIALDLGTGKELWQTGARSASSGWAEPPRVIPVRGAVTGMTGSGTLFSVDPGHPDAKPSPPASPLAPRPASPTRDGQKGLERWERTELP